MMVTQDLLAQVRAQTSIQNGQFTVEDIYLALNRNYDRSLVREAIWFLISRGEVDITRDRMFVTLTK